MRSQPLPASSAPGWGVTYLASESKRYYEVVCSHLMTFADHPSHLSQARAKTEEGTPSSPSSSSASCLECPALRDKLVERSAEVQASREQATALSNIVVYNVV